MIGIYGAGRVTTDDTEELIWLRNMNQQTELTNIETEGRNMRRPGRALQDEIDANKSRRRRERAKAQREREACALAANYNRPNLEQAVREVVFQTMLLKEIGQRLNCQFEAHSQQLKSEVEDQYRFYKRVENDLFQRLGLVGITKEDRQLALSQLPAHELQPLQILEGVLSNCVGLTIAMLEVGPKSDKHFFLRVRKMAMEVMDDEVFNGRVDEQVNNLLTNANLLNVSNDRSRGPSP